MSPDPARVMSAFVRVLMVSFALLLPWSDSAATMEEGKAEMKRLVDEFTTTKAMGVFAKLALKGDAEKLLADIGAFHKGQAGTSLEELGERYHLMVNNLVLLVQKRDAELARALAEFREPLWEILRDSAAYSHLMS